MLIDAVRALTMPSKMPGILVECIKSGTVFQIDTVAQYLESSRYTDEPTETDIRHDLPNVAPLAPLMWLEYKRRDLGTSAIAISVVLDTTELDKESPQVQEQLGRIPPNVRWWLRAYRMAAVGWNLHLLDALMEISVCHDGSVHSLFIRSVDDEDAVGRESEVSLSTDVHTALTAICFAHCKGVTMTEHAQPRQQRRAAERAGKPPLVTYRTIDIAPVTRILHDEGDIEHNGIKKALHICRGHFAHYTEDAPLFGRYTGTFFKPMHVRGSMERGVVVKDYNVTDKAAHLT